MATFTYNGKPYEIVQRPTFGEIEWVEKQAKQGFDEMGGLTKMAALVLLSVRRAGVPMTWQEVRELSPADIQVERDEAELDPTAAGSSDEAGSQT